MPNNVFRPKEAQSVRHITPNDEDRKEFNKQFREQKEHESKLKEERFKKIDAERSKRRLGNKGGGINIEVTSD